MSKKQHTQPCKECPWRRGAMRTWLGEDGTPQQFLEFAHGEAIYDCHLNEDTQCAGMSIYRANMLKVPRSPEAIVLPKNKEVVFATPQEFINHHTLPPIKPKA